MTDRKKYETRDAHFSGVMATAFLLIGVMVVGLAFSWAVYELFRSRPAGPEAVAETFLMPDTAHLPPGPNLEADPSGSLAMLRAREDSILGSYGWTDSAGGIVRVPVTRAMGLYLERESKR